MDATTTDASTASWLALALVLVPLVGLAGATSAQGSPIGPYVGTVEQDGTDEHRYDNDPLDQPCAAVVVPYLVQLTYQPAADTLTLRVDLGERTLEAQGVQGEASVSFHRSLCTEFSIEVVGSEVEAVTAYDVVVCQNRALALGPMACDPFVTPG